MVSITVGTNSWVTEVAADDYIGGRILAGDYWVDGGDDNIPALITAYRWLVSNPNYSFPATATQAMKDAQCEYALFLLQHQPDLDLRIGLQTQKVVEAGIVKEKYSQPTLLPIPPVVANLIETYLTSTGFHIFDIERDEEQETDYDAVSNLTRDV